MLGAVLGAQLALAGGAWGSTGGTAYLLDGLPIAILASYQTDVASDVTLTVQQKLPGRQVNGKCVATTKQNSKHKRCTRLNSLAGRIVQTARSGANTLNVGATIGRAHLGAGTYQLSFTPSGGTPVTKVLKITN